MINRPAAHGNPDSPLEEGQFLASPTRLQHDKPIITGMFPHEISEISNAFGRVATAFA